MSTKAKPVLRVAPAPVATTPELSGAFQTCMKVLGFIPKSGWHIGKHTG